MLKNLYFIEKDKFITQNILYFVITLRFIEMFDKNSRKIFIRNLFLIFIVTFLFFSTAYAQEPKNISFCQDITEPGLYVLNDTLTGTQTGKNYCINIQNENVTLDCNFNLIVDSNRAIQIDSGNSTIKNCDIRNPTYGIYINSASDNLIKNNNISDCFECIILWGTSYRNEIINNNIFRGITGVLLHHLSRADLINNDISNHTRSGVETYTSARVNLINNTLSYNGCSGTYITSGSGELINNTASNNKKHGFYITSSYSLKNNTALENDKWDLYMPATIINLENLTIGNSTENTTISLNRTHIKLRNSQTIPEKPENFGDINNYIQILNLSKNSWAEFNIYYNKEDLVNLNETSISMFKHDGILWENLIDSELYINDSYVYSSNITDFSVFTILGELKYELNINSTPGGSIVEPGEGNFVYKNGTVVDLIATPDVNYEFVEWSGDVENIANISNYNTTIIIEGNYSIKANFELIEYDLNINSTEGGNITTPGENTFTYTNGTEVTIIAEPDQLYEFVNWTGDTDTIYNVDDMNTTIEIVDDYNITANFALKEDTSTRTSSRRTSTIEVDITLIPKEIEINSNETKIVEILIQNTGTEFISDVQLILNGLDENFYRFSKNNFGLNSNSEKTIDLILTPEFVRTGEYNSEVIFESTPITISEDFVLIVYNIFEKETIETCGNALDYINKLETEEFETKKLREQYKNSEDLMNENYFENALQICSLILEFEPEKDIEEEYIEEEIISVQPEISTGITGLFISATENFSLKDISSSEFIIIFAIAFASIAILLYSKFTFNKK